MLRRLDRARRLIVEGMALFEVALRAEIADQSHLSPQFRSANGVSGPTLHDAIAESAGI